MKAFFTFLLTFFLGNCSPPTPAINHKDSDLVQTNKTDTLKLDWLIPVKQTVRISSNLYSDFEVDQKGNAYVASFAMNPSGSEHPYIAKISAKGVVEWELGEGVNGRALGIGMTSKGTLWVSGFYTGAIQFGTKKGPDQEGRNAFLAHFDAGGNCLSLITGNGSGMLFNTEIDKNGNMLLYGIGGNNFSFQGGNFVSEGEEGSFLALLDDQLQCKWMIPFAASIIKLAATDQGFLVSGVFNKQLKWKDQVLKTNDSFDNDAFVLFISNSTQQSWIRQMGNRGNARYGYRSNEGAIGAQVDKDNHIRVIWKKEDAVMPSGIHADQEVRLSILHHRYTLDGQLLEEQSLVEDNLSTTEMMTFALSANDYSFLTFNCDENCLGAFGETSQPAYPSQYLLQLSPNLKKIGGLPFNYSDFASIRVTKAVADELYFTGHFRGELEAGEVKLSNSGGHTLFMGKIADIPDY